MELDEEWLSLILEAKKLGLSIGELRDFFRLNGPIKDGSDLLVTKKVDKNG